MRAFIFFLTMILLGCGPKLTYINSKALENNQQIHQDSSIVTWLQPLTDSLNSEMNQIIGYTPFNIQPIRARNRITEHQQHKANLARLVTDYTLQFSQEFASKNNLPKPELVVLNHNGLRNGIDSGNISKGTIFEVMPFDNEVLLLVLSGSQMTELFNYIATIGGSPISGAELHLDSTIFTKAVINGNTFDSRRSYCIATVDFMYEGGDGFTMLKTPKRVFQTGKLLRDIILEGIEMEYKQSGTIENRNSPRIFHKK